MFRTSLAVGVLALALVAGTGSATADVASSAGCVAQFLSDLHQADVVTVGQVQGSKPDGQAHVYQPFGQVLKVQATGGKSDCPFTFEP